MRVEYYLVDLGMPLGADAVAVADNHLEGLLEGVPIVEDHLAAGLPLLLAGASHHQLVVRTEEDVCLIKSAEQTLGSMNWFLKTPENNSLKLDL